MRCLRTSFYDHAGPAGLTTVTRDCDLRDTLESTAIQMKNVAADQGSLALTEIFHTEELSVAQASIEGMRRLDERIEREMNQALLYYWTVKEWRILTPGGTLMMDKPAPLEREEIAVVLEQLARHPQYERFRVISTTEAGALVVLANGVIESPS